MQTHAAENQLPADNACSQQHSQNACNSDA